MEKETLEQSTRSRIAGQGLSDPYPGCLTPWDGRLASYQRDHAKGCMAMMSIGIY